MNLKEVLIKHNPYVPSRTTYQSIPELNVKGQRETDYRAKICKFDDINFKGKTVLDWGSDMGGFCREAVRRGAKRAVGLDLHEKTINIAKEISRRLEIKKTDFYAIDLGKEGLIQKIKRITKQDAFDIHFFFSMIRHIDFPEGVGEICNELFIVESNTAGFPVSLLEKEFSSVEKIGYTMDRHRRIVLWGKK